MHIEFHEALTDEGKQSAIWDMLCRYDHAFIPPLSSRENTYQSDLSAEGSGRAAPIQYFENLKQQSFLLALHHQQVVGFMSFRSNYISADLNDDITTTYITTIIVDEEHRGKGITTSFYKEMMKYSEDHNKTITTRTWSTNHDHIRVLEKMGFQEVKRIEDGRSKGIDTVYFRKFI